MKAHHVGCLTQNIHESIVVYASMGFGKVSEIFNINAQNVKVCFIEIRENFFLELVEFDEDNHSFSKIFKSKNPYYHIGYLVENIVSTIQQLENEGFRVINQFNSEAFNGKLCAFLLSPEMHLVELMEE